MLTLQKMFLELLVVVRAPVQIVVDGNVVVMMAGKVTNVTKVII